MEGIQTVAVEKESIRTIYRKSASSLTGIGRFIGADRERQMRSLEAGLVVCLRFVACKSKRITMRTRWCVPYLLSRELRFRPIEYSMRATSYRCMRAANQIFLSVNVHARGRRRRNRISRTGSSRTERSDKGQITEAAAAAAWSRRKGYLIYASCSSSRCQDAGRASFLDTKVHAEIPRPLYNAEPCALARLDRHSNRHCNLRTPSLRLPYSPSVYFL